MIKFYYHYDKDAHKAKFVITEGETEVPTLVDKIICSVRTETERHELPPKFIVVGVANELEFYFDSKGNETVKIS
jgi:hypothetical protein